MKILQRNIELLAGKTISEKTMLGSEKLTEKTDKRKTTEWVKSAMEKLDTLADENTRVRTMENCGSNYAKVNNKIIEKAKKRRTRFRHLEDFFKAEIQKPMAGTRLSLDGETIYQFYTPRAFTRPMRCYCTLLRGLPESEEVSLTYCHCAKGIGRPSWKNL